MGLARARADIIALGALAAAVAAFFWDVLLGPRVLLPVDVLLTVAPWGGPGQVVPHNALIGDAILQNVAWKSFARAAVLRGELPLWNPHVVAGMPFLAGGQSGSLYPLGALFYLVPLERAYGPFLALHVYLGGAFAYAFARVLGTRPAAALIGCLTFAFSAFLIVSFTWPMILSAAVWLPLLLLFVELIVRGAERGSPLRWQFALALIGAIALCLQILAGHLEITFYAAFSLLFYALVRLALGPLRIGRMQAATRAFTALAVMGLGGPALAAVQLLPFYELIGQNFRGGFVTLEQVRGYALPWRQLATFVVPDFYGNPSHHSYFSIYGGEWRLPPGTTDPPRTIWWGFPKNYVEAASYVGLLPVLLAALAVPLVRTRQVAALAALGVWSLLLAFGSPLYALLFFGVPGFDQLHTPFRWIYPYTLVVALLAALGAEALARRAPAWVARAAMALAALGAGAALALGIVAAAPSLFVSLADAVLARSERLRGTFTDGDMLLSYQWRNLLLLTLVLAGSGAVLWLLSRQTRRGLALGCLLVAADLFIAHAGFNTRADPATIRAEPAAIAFLRGDPEPFRVAAMADDPLPPITAMLVGIEDVRGYDTVIPRRYVEYWSLIEPARGLEYSKLQGIARAESLSSPLLRLLNVRYVLSSAPIASPAVELAHAGDVNVYRLLDPMPRAFVVGAVRGVRDDAEAWRVLAEPGFDPRQEVVLVGGVTRPAGTVGEARLLEHTPNRMRLTAQLTAPGHLVVADAWFEGWRATVDGRDAPLLRANHLFRAVDLPVGQHIVEMRYAPSSVRFGGIISAVAALALLLGLAACLAGPLLALRTGEGAGRRVARNALSGMGTSLFNKTIDFAFAIAMLRFLQAEGVGRYTLAIAISGYLEIWSNFGLNTLVMRDGAQRPDRLGAIGGASLLLRMLLWLIGVPVVILMLAVWKVAFDLADEAFVATLLLTLALVPGNVASTYSAFFYARERIEVPAGLTVVTTIVKVLLGLAGLLLGYGIVGLAAVALIGNIWTALALWLLAKRLHIADRLTASLAEARTMIAPAFPLMLNHLLATLFFRIDVLLLQPLRGDRELGYYATAYKYVDGMLIVPSAFTFAVFPMLSRLASEGQGGLRQAYALSLKLLVFVSVPLALVVTAAAYPLVALVGGRGYLPEAAIALQLLVWFLPLSYANGLTQYALVAAGQQRAITFAFVLAVGFNVAANLALIPRYGYQAAAVVTVFSELVLAIWFGRVVAREVGVSLTRALGPFLAAASGALTVFLVGERFVGGLAAVSAALVVYLGVLAIARPLDAHERGQLAHLTRSLRLS